MTDVILGVSAFGHDAAASVVDKKTGKVLYAVAEERLNNLKHSKVFPIGSIKRCEEYAKNCNLTIADIAINFDEIQFIRGTLSSEIRSIFGNQMDELIETIVDLYHYGDHYSLKYETFSTTVINQALEKLKISQSQHEFLRKRIYWYYNLSMQSKRTVGMLSALYPEIKIHRVRHHLCHAANAFFSSGFPQATIIINDGKGESDTVSIYSGSEREIQLVSSSSVPHSLGRFYLNVTFRLGFKFGDEYKVMGMAAYGQPKYLDLLRNIITVKENGQIAFNNTEYYKKQDSKRYFGFLGFDFTEKMDRIVHRRTRSQEITQEHFDFACSAQKLLEIVGIEVAQKAISLTKIGDLALAGGVALNGLLNEQIRLHSGCKNLFIYPAATDDGTSVGAAQYVASQYGKLAPELIQNCFYGYSPEAREIETELQRQELIYEKVGNIHQAIARLIANHQIVARYTGRSEFGPRALGNRSILANPCDPKMKDILNRRIKHREPFRPFAPACLREYANEYFEIDVDAPFMLLVVRVKPKAQKEIPAVVHADNTSRVQTVSGKHNPEFYQTIEAFRKLTDIPVLINTSFNINGEAIVDTPLDAIESFIYMDIDYLAIGDFLVSKQLNQNRFSTLSDSEFLDIRKNRFSNSIDHVLKDYDLNKFYFD